MDLGRRGRWTHDGHRAQTMEFKSPEDVVIDSQHVSYAFAVLSLKVSPGQPMPQPANPTFEDVRCPPGRLYRVIVTWEKERDPGASVGREEPRMAFTHPNKVCRGCTTATSETLASAIRNAVLETDPSVLEITPAELPLLIGKVHLLQEPQVLSRSNEVLSWKPDLHGLGLVAPRYKPPNQEGPSVKCERFFLSEVPRNLKWSFKTTFTKLVEQAGYSNYVFLHEDPLPFCQSLANRTGSEVTVLSFKSSSYGGEWSDPDILREAAGWQSVEHEEIRSIVRNPEGGQKHVLADVEGEPEYSQVLKDGDRNEFPPSPIAADDFEFIQCSEGNDDGCDSDGVLV
jgi:AMMECR1 domain-containing protein